MGLSKSAFAFAKCFDQSGNGVSTGLQCAEDILHWALEETNEFAEEFLLLEPQQIGCVGIQVK